MEPVLTQQKRPSHRRYGYWFLVVLLVLAALLAIGYTYRNSTAQYHQQMQDRLRLVGEGQSKNIAHWRSTRMADAATISQDPFFAQALAQWQHHPSAPLARQLQERLSSLVEYSQYAVAYLLDTQGRLVLGTDNRAEIPPLPAQEQAALQQALDSALPVAIEARPSPYFAFPFFGVMAPLFDGYTPVGAVWLVMDLRSTLYPLLQDWQVDNQDAEVLLLQRLPDGSNTNVNPRPQAGLPAFGQTMPMTHTASPGVQAIAGARGIVRGVNYRNEPVIAMVSAIDDAPWWLVVQLPEANAIGDTQRREGVTLGLSVGAVFIFIGLLLGLWQWRAWRHERDLQHALQLHMRWLDTAQKAATLGYFVYAPSKQEFFISETTQRIFGLPHAGWIALQQWAALLLPQERQGVLHAHDTAIANAQPLHTQYAIQRQDTGEQRWIQIWAEMDAERQHMIGIAQDITERRALDEQLHQYRQRLESQVRQDPLTGIANRLALEEAVEREWRRAERQGLPLGLLMLDLDYFKTYNDTYGHVQGDACLRAVAATLAAHAGRAGELVARYGGEEFAVLLPGLTLAQTQAVGARLVQAVRALQLPHQGNMAQGGVVTISIGAACVQPAHDHGCMTTWFQQADAALYAAKQAGRNRCCASAS